MNSKYKVLFVTQKVLEYVTEQIMKHGCCNTHNECLNVIAFLQKRGHDLTATQVKCICNYIDTQVGKGYSAVLDLFSVVKKLGKIIDCAENYTICQLYEKIALEFHGTNELKFLADLMGVKIDTYGYPLNDSNNRKIGLIMTLEEIRENALRTGNTYVMVFSADMGDGRKYLAVPIDVAIRAGDNLMLCNLVKPDMYHGIYQIITTATFQKQDAVNRDVVEYVPMYIAVAGLPNEVNAIATCLGEL